MEDDGTKPSKFEGEYNFNLGSHSTPKSDRRNPFSDVENRKPTDVTSKRGNPISFIPNGWTAVDEHGNSQPRTYFQNKIVRPVIGTVTHPSKWFSSLKTPTEHQT